MNLADKRLPLHSSRTSGRVSWMDYLRITLGIIILAKGISFVNDREAVRSLIEQTHFQLSIWGAVHYVVFTHLVGGIFIILGFQTRLACILLLPVLVGAVFFCEYHLRLWIPEFRTVAFCDSTAAIDSFYDPRIGKLLFG